MPDSGFREIQLSGKHVVFLFISGVVAAVAIFLLGVSVGRGVAGSASTAEATPTPAAAATDADQSAELPPSTAPAPGELTYPTTLRGKGDAAGAPAAPAVTPSPTASPAPVVTPAAPAPAAASAPTAKPSAAAVWYVQVDAFRTRANAVTRVQQLKTKGIAAAVFTAPGSGARYRVRVGPLDRPAAEAMKARLLKEGFKSSITR